MDGGRGSGRGRAWQPRGRSSPMPMGVGRGRGRGRGWSSSPNSPFHFHPAVGDGVSSSLPVKEEDGRICSQQNSEEASGGSSFSHYSQERMTSPSPETQDGSPSRNVEMHVSDVSNKLNTSKLHDDIDTGDAIQNSESMDNPKTSTTSHKTHHPDSEQPLPLPVDLDPFDICLPKQSGTVVLKPPLLVKNRERRNEIKRNNNNMDTNRGIVLRPGMVLLKGYISLTDQVKIVKRCRDLGLGSGGFYQPGYREGTKLHLKMMCLGKNWDPQTSEYGDCRPSDGAKPPDIPVEFHQLVEKAIRDSHALIEQASKTGNPDKILPWMSSNICIVNFYSQNGRLGLHQDKDESEESIHQGLPVVSFSLGDSADFLYGDERNVDKAEKVVLESGDVLIFGGTSRNVFHGVTAIRPDTAPKLLLDETNLRPGRLNLTFRQY